MRSVASEPVYILVEGGVGGGEGNTEMFANCFWPPFPSTCTCIRVNYSISVPCGITWCHAGRHMVPEGAGYSDGLEADQPLVLVGANVVLLVRTQIYVYVCVFCSIIVLNMCILTLSSDTIYISAAVPCVHFVIIKLAQFQVTQLTACLWTPLVRINTAVKPLFFPSLTHSLTHEIHMHPYSTSEKCTFLWGKKSSTICLYGREISGEHIVSLALSFSPVPTDL